MSKVKGGKEERKERWEREWEGNSVRLVRSSEMRKGGKKGKKGKAGEGVDGRKCSCWVQGEMREGRKKGKA